MWIIRDNKGVGSWPWGDTRKVFQVTLQSRDSILSNYVCLDVGEKDALLFILLFWV